MDRVWVRVQFVAAVRPNGLENRRRGHADFEPHRIWSMEVGLLTQVGHAGFPIIFTTAFYFIDCGCAWGMNLFLSKSDAFTRSTRRNRNPPREAWTRACARGLCQHVAHPAVGMRANIRSRRIAWRKFWAIFRSTHRKSETTLLKQN